MVHPLGIKESYTFSSSWITALLWWRGLYNSMKLQAMACRATPVGRVTVESSDKTQSTGGRNGKPLLYTMEKTLTLGKSGGRRRGWQRMRRLDGITSSMDMNLGKFHEMVRDREVWRAAVRGATKSQTQLGDWTTATSFPGKPWGSLVENLPASVGQAALIPGSWRCPGEGNGNPPQCSCLGNSMDRRASWATVHRVAKRSDVT